MLIFDGAVVHSAADLLLAAQCPYALARQLDRQLGRGEPKPAADDETARRAADLGRAYEQQVLAQFRQQYPGRVVDLTESGQVTERRLSAAWQRTASALNSGAAVLYQPTIYDGQFYGRPDFLISDNQGRWQVADAKLARSTRTTALLQLAAYADRLVAAGVTIADQASLLLGDGREQFFAIADITGVYTERARLFNEFITARIAGEPVRWSQVRGCGCCPECEVAVAEYRDVWTVAGMRGNQREKLQAAGITTIDQLAAAQSLPHGLAPLQLQAQLQLEPGRIRVIDPAALAKIPEPDAGDLFFDFEGDPLWLDPDGPVDAELGLEYLFGTTDSDDVFRPFWAHTRAAEAIALREFLDFVAQRRAEFPDMHIYHYAAYERTALLRLAARHGVGEEEVDELLRSGVLVDLYSVVRRGLRLGVSSYSLKKLEPLYMGDQLRAGDVVSAGASVVAYHEYCQARISDPATAQQLLASIADYNEDDCRSTRGLRDWLRGLRPDVYADSARVGDAVADGAPGPAGSGAPGPAGSSAGALAPAQSADQPHEQTAQRLFAQAGPAPRSPDQQGLALLAAALGYHWREEKPFWWRHFERLAADEAELAEDNDIFLVTATTELNGWHRPPRARKPHRLLRMAGLQPDKPLSGTVYMLYDHLTDAMSGAAGANRGWTVGTITATEIEDGQDILEVSEAIPVGATGIDQAPVALAPSAGPRTTGLRRAIAEIAEAGLAGSAIGELLARRPPADLATVQGGNYAQAIITSLLSAGSSYLAVQGPPGTGKTHTGAQVITDLLGRGWRIGVVAQSHATVENLLEAIVAAGADPERVGKQPANPNRAHAWNGLPRKDYADFLANGPAVLGGTAWDFVNPDRVGRSQLDLLVIDEAGQFSLADTIAVSISAQRMLLLGDGQQLPGVTIGTHPEPVDISALMYLAAGHARLPAEFGYFLERTYRMHPTLCRAVSRHSYEGKLASHTEITARRQLDGIDPGVHLRLVPHEGNTQRSQQEAAEAADVIADLLGRTWRSPDTERALTEADILVVAPYNAQVHLIRGVLDRAGLPDISVGTVDKFQGRQAPVVIVSMTASSAADAARGASFLFSRNRINVAISRAQYAAYVLRSPNLTDQLPTDATAFAELGAFLGLTAP